MADPFAERMAQVRTRFAAKLNDRVASLDTAVPGLVGDGPAIVQALEVAHRTAHDLCGVGPTIGFHETGKAARKVEQLLLSPLRAARGLSAQEAEHVRREIAALRAAAQADLETQNASVE
jgi:HPt (histidine-containing phosphotransfer) domain-containing protein